MSWVSRLPAGRSWVVTATVGGMLVILTIAGTVGLIINQNVNDVTHNALDTDVRLENTGSDLRAAVLDLRHYHRNFVFAGPSRGGTADFDAAYRTLLTEIDEFERLQIEISAIPEATELRALAEQYYSDFRPAIDRYATDRQAFTVASDEGLVRIATLEEAAREIDRVGHERATDALENVEQSTRTATFDLVVVLAGLIVVGVGLAYLGVRTANQMRALNAEQQATANELAYALDARNRFIADVSHELRTPITILRGNAEVGLELDRGGVHEQIFEEIVKESTRMSRLVEDLLFLARSDINELPLDLTEVDVLTLLDGIRGPASILAQQRGGTLVIDVRGNGRLAADTERIEQATLILVDNAVKYGAEQAPITLNLTVRESTLEVAVSDAGPGIPDDEIPQIFERFHRVDKTRSRKLGGAGLGLAIARSIVEAHGGQITVASSAGKGTTMTIALPLLGTTMPGRPAEMRSHGTG